MSSANERKRLRFSALGPLRLWHDGRELPVGSPQQQALLAALVLREGRPATPDELIRAIWDDDPPRAALGTARTYISRLRRLLTDTGAAIVTVGETYVLTGDHLSADVWDLRAALDRAQALLRAGDPVAAAAALDAVLAEESGVPLSGISGAWAEAQRTRLTELRASAAEVRLSARLESTDPTPEDVAELTRMVAGHPLREGPRALLMLALYRRGRRAEALDVYRDGHRLLRDALGLDPGPALSDMHGRILRGDVPTVTAARPAALLPPDLADFVGRRTEVDALVAALEGRARLAGVYGLAGIGRTATAVHTARRIAAAFPAGVLYSDLRDAGGIDGVLLEWLKLLGADHDVPATRGGRAAALGALTAGRELLLVLDNVDDAAQIDLVRRVAPDAALLVTADRQLVATAALTWVRLGGLSDPDSVDLFASVAGAARAAAEPEAVRRIVELCGGYPIGIRMAAHRVRTRPRWSIAEVAEQLAGDMDDPYGEVHHDCVVATAAIMRAYGQLEPFAARVLRLVGVLPAEQVSAHDVAVRLDVPAHRAFFTLDTLADVALLVEAGDGYRPTNPLIRSVAKRAAAVPQYH
ncbi:BTAD domain-containing putative transcriptional regulator [Cryptosporangium sp. NPDC048952]|uniref:AfsR/SARP family transcriptional regulator n=1 Tax=Cryptosporangium sp. NPDC048952 TaxID=3363961 RepID=UPI00371BE838